ncbi:MAG TPA: glycosyltransferase family 39 protein [Acidimicrobiales bacterium]|nr:glycosyltransferase family 39 protein [Acidimicrobiales bacterium]
MSAAAASVRARALALPAWVWLAAIVVGSIALRLVLARRMVAPWIMVDELIYSELAKSFAAHGSFLVRGVPSHGFGFVYPILIAPAFRLASVPAAYGAAKAIGTVIMSLAAIPAYFLARRVVRPPLALVAALLTVAVPSMVYTGTLMTENAFYPLFLTCALALVAVLERPTWPRVALLVALTLLAFLTRAQAVALAPAILTAPILLGRARLREFRGVYALVAAGAVLVVGWEVVHGRSPLAVLGAYQVTASTHYSVPTVFRWLVYHLGELDLYVGVAPFAALLFLLTTRERRSPFVAASVAIAAWLVVEVAAFAATQSQRIEERNMFFVAPFFFIALCWWVERGLPRPRAAGVCAVVAAALVGVVPYSGLINGNATSDTLALLPLWTLQDTVTTLDQVQQAVVGAAILITLLVLLVPTRYALALPALVLALYAVELWPIESNPHGGIQHASLGALFGGTSEPDRDWIDARLGHGGRVGVLYDSRVMDKFVVWTNEFFNRSVRNVYDLADPTPGGLPETKVRVDAATGRIPGVGEPYVLTSQALQLDEPTVLTDDTKGLAVYRVVRPLGIKSVTAGLYADGWSGPVMTYTRYRCRTGETLSVTVGGDPKLIPSASTVRVGSSRFVVRPRLQRTLSIPLRAVGSRCVVRFRISPVAVPAAVEAGSTDTRVLGLRFSGLAVR